jgi:hypothetical protein
MVYWVQCFGIEESYMRPVRHDERKEAIKSRLSQTHSEFHALLDSLSDDELRAKSINTGWTNGEILFHMMFAFILILTLVPMLRFWSRLPKGYSKKFADALNFSTVPFNFVNGLAPRLGGKVFNRKRLGRFFDRIYVSLIKLLDSVNEHEWESGMYYPDKWDPLFDEYMTLEKLFYYPIRHFEFHVGQLAR